MEFPRAKVYVRSEMLSSQQVCLEMQRESQNTVEVIFKGTPYNNDAQI